MCRVTCVGRASGVVPKESCAINSRARASPAHSGGPRPRQTTTPTRQGQPGSTTSVVSSSDRERGRTDRRRNTSGPLHAFLLSAFFSPRGQEIVEALESGDGSPLVNPLSDEAGSLRGRPCHPTPRRCSSSPRHRRPVIACSQNGSAVTLSRVILSLSEALAFEHGLHASTMC